MDLFNEPSNVSFSGSAYNTIDPELGPSYFAQPGSPIRDDRSLGGALTPRSRTVQEVAELKRQLTVAEKNLLETGVRSIHLFKFLESL